MTNDGNMIYDDKPEMWEVIFYKKEICFYSKGFYLGIKKDMENVVGSKYMKSWGFKFFEETKSYCFQLKEKKENNFLSFEGTWIKVNKNIVGRNEVFELREI